MATVGDIIETLGESATLHTRVLGARNAVTNQPAVTYTDSTIKLLLQEAGTQGIDTPAGLLVNKRYNGFVSSTITVNHLDQVTINSIRYEVSTTPTTVYYEATTSFKKLDLVRVTP